MRATARERIQADRDSADPRTPSDAVANRFGSSENQSLQRILRSSDARGSLGAPDLPRTKQAEERFGAGLISS